MISKSNKTWLCSCWWFFRSLVTLFTFDLIYVNKVGRFCTCKTYSRKHNWYWKANLKMLLPRAIVEIVTFGRYTL